MRIHRLNCGSFTPPGFTRAVPTYCLLVETNEGLVLVDSGLGVRDCTHPTWRIRLYARTLGAAMEMEETARRQIVRLGYRHEDVTHIVLTHMHLDHTGGLPDFPQARVHVSTAEYAAMHHPRGLWARASVETAHFAHAPRWVQHTLHERWHGFEAAPILAGLTPNVVMVSLPGHTPGHCGVAVEVTGGWLLHGGDAIIPLHPAADLHPAAEHAYPLSRLPAAFVSRFVGPHIPRLRALVREDPTIHAFGSHDPYGAFPLEAPASEG